MAQSVTAHKGSRKGWDLLGLACILRKVPSYGNRLSVFCTAIAELHRMCYSYKEKRFVWLGVLAAGKFKGLAVVSAQSVARAFCSVSPWWKAEGQDRLDLRPQALF